MGRTYAIDMFGNALVLLWLGFSTYFAWAANGEYFQRMGAFGVASGVLYFAFVSHAPEFSSIIRSRFAGFRKMQNLHTQHIEGNYRNSGIIAYEVKKLRKELNLPGSSGVDAISATFVETLAKEPIEAAKLDAQFEEIELNEERAAEQVERQRFFSNNYEVLIVVIATLQWGFGDLLFGLVHDGVR